MRKPPNKRDESTLAMAPSMAIDHCCLTWMDVPISGKEELARNAFSKSVWDIWKQIKQAIGQAICCRWNFSDLFCPPRHRSQRSSSQPWTGCQHRPRVAAGGRSPNSSGTMLGQWGIWLAWVFGFFHSIIVHVGFELFVHQVLGNTWQYPNHIPAWTHKLNPQHPRMAYYCSCYALYSPLQAAWISHKWVHGCYGR